MSNFKNVTYELSWYYFSICRNYFGEERKKQTDGKIKLSKFFQIKLD